MLIIATCCEAGQPLKNCRTWREPCQSDAPSGTLGPADAAPRRSGLGLYNGFAVERRTPVDGRREGGGATLAHARGVTGPDDGWPDGAVPAGPPTSTRRTGTEQIQAGQMRGP
jgi:hypothetical protein